MKYLFLDNLETFLCFSLLLANAYGSGCSGPQQDYWNWHLKIHNTWHKTACHMSLWGNRSSISDTATDCAHSKQSLRYTGWREVNKGRHVGSLDVECVSYINEYLSAMTCGDLAPCLFKNTINNCKISTDLAGIKLYTSTGRVPDKTWIRIFWYNTLNTEQLTKARRIEYI